MTQFYTHQKHRTTAYRAWIGSLTGLLAFWLLPAFGAATPHNSATRALDVPALATVLNLDGTLRADAHGSFDARGYQFSKTPDGLPQFHSANTLGAGDEKWQEGFGINGTDDEVKALVYSPAGELYAGGKFTAAGTAPAIRIGKWDGTRWNALGTGIGENVPYYTGTDVVNAIAVDKAGNVYAGGLFTQAGGIAVSNIAKWDGTQWSALGTGLSYTVQALAIDGAGNVYAGGQFIQAGGIAVSNIAKWDGTRWSALGAGLTYRVQTLAIDGTGNVYAAGTQSSGGAYINKWNGTTWSQLGTGLGSIYGEVRALVVDGTGNVYAGGAFNTAGGVAVNNVAKWDGTSWSALGTGIPDRVYALALDGAGNFYAAGDAQGSRVLKWNGTRWVVVATVNRIVSTLAADGAGGVVAGGTFQSAGSLEANFVAKWDGTRWSNLATGLNRTVFAVAADGKGNIYVGGSFTAAGGLAANLIAKWDGTRWSTLGTGLVGVAVFALAVDGAGNVYAGGSFTRAGNKSAISIAKWDGTNWSALSAGLTQASYPGEVYALAVDGAGNVYAGGSFGQTGSLVVNGLAKWDGTNWSALGTGFDFTVRALALDGMGTVYAGGDFTRAGGVAANYVAKWDGTRWSALGSGALYAVRALAFARNGKLYAGGDRIFNFGVPTCLAAWDGTSWSAITTPTGGQVNALALDGNDNLYVGGSFTAIGTMAAKRVAKWDGTRWTTLGTGLNQEVRALAVRGASPLCVGGEFNAVGDGSKVTAYVGLYDTGASPLSMHTPLRQRSAVIQLYPNPTQSRFIVKCSAGRIEQGQLLNSQGQVIRHLSPSTLQTAVDIRGLAAGVYTVQVVVKGEVVSQRLVVE
ncbi:T9SS type A sorting domain-containing protein [Hymenobacter elongatus]|uniref:T9SS type A sorting domain-containing protein n=1 Tax=Hymenobacter elongatus TaxID=877208 RepID=A0A4Z0PHE1_9BACT|nr:T9SS type A sorting domain-containing protein [Hymenobacter elongatus]